MSQLRAAHPDIEITEAFNFVDPVVENYEGSMKLLIEGAVLAVIVVWLFLRDGRATFVAATALPLSVIPTFAVMLLMGFSLNVVTLLSMSLVVGILVGTAMQMIHDELPGTTFSNPDQRGDYDSENKAALTLRELERWLTLAVGTYHGSVHNGLLQPPAARWAEAVARVGVPAVVTRATSFLVDFLPILRRTLTRTGFVIDHIHYYADALKPWIARRERWPSFLIRRDPRDISRIWVLEPEGQHYLEIPYRTLSHPAVTLWEQRQALAKLRQQGREQVDESALFRMIGQMREIVTSAQKATRKARRDADRRQHLKTSARPDKPVPPDTDIADPQADNLPPAKPFDQIEEW